jgi:non-specific serine/threonine protein kinase
LFVYNKTRRRRARILNAYITKTSFSVEKTDHEENQNIFDGFLKDKYEALFYFGFEDKPKDITPGMNYLHFISEYFIKALSYLPGIEVLREKVELELSKEDERDLLEGMPFIIGMEHVTKEWLVLQWQSLLKTFQDLISNTKLSVQEFFERLNTEIHIADRVYFHLVEQKNGPKPFAFLATYSVEKNNKAKHLPLKHALESFKDDQKKLIQLISSVIKASEKSAFISDVLTSGELYAPLGLTEKEAYGFLKDIEIYESFGIMCRIPNWWKKRNRNLGVKISIGNDKPSKVGLDALMDFRPEIYLGDRAITKEELNHFLQLSEGLLMFKGQWIEINKNNLEKISQAMDHMEGLLNNEGLSLKEVMQMQLGSSKDLSHGEVAIEYTNGMWLQETLSNLKMPSETVFKIEDTFKATFRDYQKIGYKWLLQMQHYNFGACLADDMGLGKTVQVIGFLEYVRKNQGGQGLLILPASLIGNWEKEIQKFAPDLAYKVLHSSKGKNSIEEISADDFLIITTYGMVKRLELLKEKTFNYLILDEAQAIKNPATKQTKAIKALNADMKIALTGTPIENNLGDLWSLFDFLNKGLLGSMKEFKQFTKNLSDHPLGYSKLKKVISPFIMRRMKTDPAIVPDLPDKLEFNKYTLLTQKQEVLYKKVLKDVAKKLEGAEGIERKGLVLSSIMKFKQICNHPSQYLGDYDYNEKSSGKFLQLKSICENIYEKRERVIVFTQFKEMTGPISDYLEGIFNKKGLVLHGGTPVKKRQDMVDTFNGEAYLPYMVLSLKAGGVGLNLTAANHVIHFDRWWNPAVENQGTDRAFRIGQNKDVMVYKFITKGSIEEKISEMLEDKSKLSEDILQDSGEKWITEYNNDELMALFSLGGDE